MIKLFPIIPIWIMALVCIALAVMILVRPKKNYLRIAIIALLFVINLRIMYGSEGAMIPSTDLDVLFVIDSTISMNAEDFGMSRQPRLDAVKEDCKYIVEQLSGSSFSIIQFDNTAKILMPFARDAYVIDSAIDGITPIGNYYARGSSLDAPIDSMSRVLKSSKSNANGRGRIVIYISDGEITEDGGKVGDYSKLASLIDGGAVLGYGTEAGGKMRSFAASWDDDGESEAPYLEYWDGGQKIEAVSKLDENNLRKIASDMGVEYKHVTDNTAIESLVHELKNKTIMTVQIDEDVSSYSDTYYWFVIPTVILMLIDLHLVRRKNI